MKKLHMSRQVSQSQILKTKIGPMCTGPAECSQEMSWSVVGGNLLP